MKAIPQNGDFDSLDTQMQVSVNNGSTWIEYSLFKGRYTLGDKLQQHVGATDHSMWTGRATSCSNTVRRHVAATNRFVYTEVLWKSLSSQQNFVAARSRKKSNQTEFVRLVAATKFFCSNKDFHKNPAVRAKRFVAADVSPRRVGATCRLVCTDHAFIRVYPLFQHLIRNTGNVPIQWNVYSTNTTDPFPRKTGKAV